MSILVVIFLFCSIFLEVKKTYLGYLYDPETKLFNGALSKQKAWLADACNYGVHIDICRIIGPTLPIHFHLVTNHYLGQKLPLCIV